MRGVSWGYGGMLSGEGIPSGRGKGAMTWAGYAHTFWVVDRAKDVAFGEPFAAGLCRRETDGALAQWFGRTCSLPSVGDAVSRADTLCSVPFGSQKIFDLWEKAEPEIYKGIA